LSAFVDLGQEGQSEDDIRERSHFALVDQLNEREHPQGVQQQGNFDEDSLLEKLLVQQ
jgi:hypothetical protein